MKKSKKQAELEVKEKTKREAEEARKAKQAQVTVEKAAELESRDRIKREAEKAGKPEIAGAERGKGVERGIAATADTEFYQGLVKLVLVPPILLRQMRRFEAGLSEIEGLSLDLVGGAVDGGTEIILSVENSIPLLDVLRELSSVAEVVKEGKSIRVVLKKE